MRTLTILAWAALTACASAGSGAQPAAPLTLEERAQALNEVLGMRYDRISSNPPVDACSVFLVLDRDRGFRERLGQFQRRWLSPESAEACPASLSAHRWINPGWYLREISRGGPDELRVTAVQSVAGQGGHTETYLLHHGYGDPRLWRLREIRISRFSFD
ncbi:MAG TPA: hypothetical protein VGB15_20280 [Longimicrobium sp.]